MRSLPPFIKMCDASFKEHFSLASQFPFFHDIIFLNIATIGIESPFFCSFSDSQMLSLKHFCPFFFATILAPILFGFDQMPPLDPSISTQSPHLAPSSDSCVGQCAFVFVDRMSAQLGTERSAGLLNLNYNDFLTAFSNSTFFEAFCNLYHEFNFCYTKCPQGYLQELLARSAEIVDHFCVWNYKAIMAKFGCLAGMDRESSGKCLHSCTGHHHAVTSLMQNFKHLALNGDATEAERYLEQSCEYVACTLHCDVPAIHALCGRDTAELVVNLTRKSFESMQRMALDTGAVGRWPAPCADIRSYAVPPVASKGRKAGVENGMIPASQMRRRAGTNGAGPITGGPPSLLIILVSSFSAIILRHF